MEMGGEIFKKSAIVADPAYYLLSDSKTHIRVEVYSMVGNYLKLFALG